MSETNTEAPVTEEQAAPQGASQGEAQAAPQAGSPRQDIFSKLADAGEEVIARVAGIPGAARALEQAQTSLHRLDDLQKRLLGVEAIERRVVELEAKVAALEPRPAAGDPS